MNKLLIALCLTLAASSMAYAAEEKAATPQQERMRACNKDAGDKGLKGDERKQFMSQCLKGDTGAAMADKPKTAQQQKMADCSKKAKEDGIKGKEARNKFMSECLKGDKQ